MRVIEVGIRELQRSTSRVMRAVTHGDTGVVVTRHGRAVGVVISVARASSWILANRPLRTPGADYDEETWIEEGRLRLSPDVVDLLDEPGARRLKTRIGVMAAKIDAAGGAYGRIAIRCGARWALLDFDGPGRPIHVVAVKPHREVRTWIYGGARDPVSLADALSPPPPL